MINVGRVVLSSNFKQPFIIHRKTGIWDKGRFTQTELSSIDVEGVVNVANPKELMQLPEGDRIAGTMAFYCPQKLYVTHAYNAEDTNTHGTSDELEWKGVRYKITNVFDYELQGYFKAFAVYMEGA
jgi:hypothetical protein